MSLVPDTIVVKQTIVSLQYALVLNSGEKDLCSLNLHWPEKSSEVVFF